MRPIVRKLPEIRSNRDGGFRCSWLNDGVSCRLALIERLVFYLLGGRLDSYVG